MSSGVGVLSGTASALFLTLLSFATEYRNDHQGVIWLLPLAGLAIGLTYHQFGRSVEKGTGLILEEIHRSQTVIPFRLAPLVLFGTLGTHLFGGSAGREGTVVQMGASLADQLSAIFQIENHERKILLIAGIGSGFSAALGAPFAGALFGLEVMQIGKLRFFAVSECLIASFVAFYTCRFLGAPHTEFPQIQIPQFLIPSFFWTAIAGIAFGLAAALFVKVTHRVDQLQRRLFHFAPLRPLVAGLLLAVFFYLEGTYRYAGLGLPTILESFSRTASWRDPIFKIFFTALTLGSGFKGGEFIPLVFIGTTLGSLLSLALPVSLSLLAALGFAAVFGAAANTPISCAVMAMEIFGWRIAPFAFLACWIAYYTTGNLGIYHNQPVARSKKDQLLLVFRSRNKSKH